MVFVVRCLLFHAFVVALAEVSCTAKMASCVFGFVHVQQVRYTEPNSTTRL